MVLDGKSSQEYSTNDRVPQGFILGLTPFLLCTNDIPDYVICNIVIFPDDTTFYSKRDRTPDLWQHLEFDFDLESDQPDIVDWGRNG